MGEEEVLYGAKAFIYFVRQADKEFNSTYIHTLESYQKRRRWRFLELVPSLFFALFFSVSLLLIFQYGPSGENKSFILFVFGGMSLASIYVLYEDIKTFREVFYPEESPSFLFGRVVGKLVKRKKNENIYWILFEVGNDTTPQVLAVNVSKRVFGDAEDGEGYWLFSEKYDLYAIKDI